MGLEPDAPAPATLVEDRRLGFEAKRFALETLVKIYVEQSNGSRALVVSHARVMLTLAIAAMAGFVTVFAAVLRGDPQAPGSISPVSIALALGGLGLLVASALFATRSLSRAAQAATDILRNPFPTAGKELEALFGARSEDIVLDKLVATIQLHIADTVPNDGFGTYATISLIAGTTLAAASLALPFATIGR